MNEEHTLEKLRIHERLSIIETEVKNSCQKIDKMFDYLVGNGHPGLKTRIDRIEQHHANKEKHWIAIYTALVGLAIKSVWDWFNK